MLKRFQALWGDMRNPKAHGRRAASAETDRESGDAGDEAGGGGAKDLFALEVLRKRDLISEEEYVRRKKKIEAGGAG